MLGGGFGGGGGDLHGDVIAGVENEQERDDGQPDLCRSGLGKAGAEAGDCDKTGQHCAGGGQEQEPAAQPVHVGRGGDGPQQVPDVEARRDQSLVRDGLDPDGIQDKRQVIRNDAVAGPLCEYAQADGDEEPMPVALRLDHIRIRGAARRLLLRGDGSLDLHDLIRNKRVIPVTSRMVSREDIRRLLDTVDADQPAGTLRRQQEPRHGHEWEHDLQQHRDAPAPVGGDVAARKSHPSAEGAAKVPAHHEQRVSDRALLRMSDLVDQQRGGVPQPRGGDADEQPGVGECDLVLGCGLHHHAQHEEQVPDVDAYLAPVVVGYPCCYGEADAVA